MTVAELIAELGKYDQSLQVVVNGDEDDDGVCLVRRTEAIKILPPCNVFTDTYEGLLERGLPALFISPGKNASNSMFPKVRKYKCKHTRGPKGYIEWSLWAREKSKTHKQTKCPVCGLFKVWVPKKSTKSKG